MDCDRDNIVKLLRKTDSHLTGLYLIICQMIRESMPGDSDIIDNIEPIRYANPHLYQDSNIKSQMYPCDRDKLIRIIKSCSQLDIYPQITSIINAWIDAERVCPKTYDLGSRFLGIVERDIKKSLVAVFNLSEFDIHDSKLPQLFEVMPNWAFYDNPIDLSDDTHYDQKNSPSVIILNLVNSSQPFNILIRDFRAKTKEISTVKILVLFTNRDSLWDNTVSAFYDVSVRYKKPK
jgi:hypothetical protein